MANAVAFFQKEVFNKDAEYEQKGELLDENLIEKKRIKYKPSTGKSGTNSSLKN